jgi:hypothetical protein
LVAVAVADTQMVLETVLTEDREAVQTDILGLFTRLVMVLLVKVIMGA